jgi:branched-chain amino acid transport system substrate-binding protein
MRRANFVLLAAFLALAWVRAGAAADFKVGLILPMTGPGADIAKNLAEGARASVPLINSRGGIGGMTVTLTVCDSQSQEQQAVLCTRRLLSEDKVDLLLGNGSTPQTIAALPIVASVGVPLFSEAAGTAIYRPLRKWVFKGLNSNEDQISVEIAYFKKKGSTRIALIRDNGPFGSDIATTFKALVANSGTTIIADEVYSPTDADMTAQVTAVRALKPDVIIDMAATAPPGALVARKIVQLGIAAPIVVGTNLQTPGFVTLVGNAADQVVFTGLKAVLSDVPKDDPLYDNITAFKAAFATANPGATLTSLSPNTADGLLITQAAARTMGAKALDHEALLHALEGTNKVPGIQGIWTFSATSHESPLVDGTAIIQYRSGKWVAAQ